MRINLVLVLTFFLCCTPVAHAAEILQGAEEPMAKIIRANGYVCDHCDKVYAWDVLHQGRQLKANCNNYKLVYEIIVTPTNRFIVRPWK